MRVKQSRSRSRKITPAPLPQRRRSKRRTTGARGAPPTLVQARSGGGTKIEPMQWFAFVAIGMTAIALIVLIWTLTSRAIADQAAEVRARTDQQVTSVAFVLAREVQNELRLVDQSLSILQDSWKKDSDSVDLGGWRKQLTALTDVADDIFIANESGVIVQGTLPQSIGMGFGSAYVTYPNGSLEMYDPDGTKNPDGKTPGADRVEARQFLMYIVRPLSRPRGWWVGASYRSEGITKLFAGASLGQNGVVGLTDTKRGALQAIVGSSAQFANMDLSESELIEQMRKNEAGVWAGVSPTDGIPRIIAYQRVAGRQMSVIVGVSVDTAIQPLAGLAAMARGLATVGSMVVLTIAAIVIWTIATTSATRQRKRTHERTELNLMNARQELAVVRARAMLTEPEAGTLLSSNVDGVARLDGEQRLRLWNQRFADLAGVPLDPSAIGTPVETLLRRQANAGLFGDVAEAEQDLSTRLTILHTSGQSVVPPTQLGPNGEQVTMHVRGVSDGGQVIILAGPENARYAALPALAGEAAEAEAETAQETAQETADETTEW
jgi:PAS domain-containing protein